MKARMMLVGAILLGATLSCRGSVARAQATAGQLPYSWFLVPEDGPAVRGVATPNYNNNYQKPKHPHGQSTSQQPISKRRGEAALAETVDRVLETTGEGLDETPLYRGQRRPPANAPADWVPWHPHELILTLGVSLTGTFGILTGQGAAAVDVFWRPKKTRMASMGIESAPARSDDEESVEREDSVPGVAIASDATDAEIDRELEPVIRTIMATRRVRDEGRMRSELRRVAFELRDVMGDANAMNRASWYVKSLWLDISVSGSGMVQPGLSVGGGVRLRFCWTATAARSDARALPVASRNVERRDAFRVLMAKIAYDLESVPGDLWQRDDFKIGYIRVAIGGFVRGKFGIARAEGSITGHAFFVKRPTRDGAPVVAMTDEIANGELPMFDGESTPGRMSYARANLVRYERVPATDRGGVDTLVYYVDRARFREGLRQSFGIAGFFAERASRETSRSWQVAEIRPQFTLSLMGVTPVVTVGGSVTLEAQYKRVARESERGVR